MSIASRPVHVDLVHRLEEPAARDPAVTGSKAAALAAARGNGLPVIPGFAVTTAAHASYLAAGRSFPPDLARPLERAWSDFTGAGRMPVVVRSSSTVEDVSASSMAGRFRSVLDVRGLDAFFQALAEVWASADAVAEGPEPNPMGVLVQRHLAPSRSGVMFGVDPVTGDRSTVVVEAVTGGPDRLVSGQVPAQHYVLGRRGRLLSVDSHPVNARHPFPTQPLLLHAGELLRLARLARTTERVFGSPQDVEWAIDDDGALYLLQSRPVTATAAAAPVDGPVLGPGPLAETFPDPLSVLESDLWLQPLRSGVVDAMSETAAVPARRISRSPVVTTVRGRVAADLELFGYVPRHSALERLNPARAMRRITVAWRIGALRAQLPGRTAEQVTDVDRWLSSVDPGAATDAALLALLEEAVAVLRRLHHHEVLAGTLLPPARTTAAALALRVLREADRAVSDTELLGQRPVLLCLSPPSLSAAAAVPPREPAAPPAGPARDSGPVGPLGEREALRLRARWVQEMTGYAVRELGRRLVERGVLEHGSHVGLLHLDELRELVATGAPSTVLQQRIADELAAAFSPPLPGQFRLTDDGEVVPAARTGARPGFGTPAGGGRGIGPVCQGSPRRPPQPGDVLVVRTLDPGLAGWLPGLAGLVAETGASLSHLAILAREYGVPTVVAVHDALTRFPAGARVLVDGATGEVRPAGEEETS